MGIEMTDTRSDEEAGDLKDPRIQLEAIFQASLEGLYLIRIEPDGSFVYVRSSPALEEMTGLRFEGEHPEALLDPDSAREVETLLRKVADTGLPVETERIYDVPKGKRRLVVKRSPVRGADGRVVGIVGVVRDVTVERRLRQQLLVAERLETLSRFSGGLAHELNNVLTGILGQVALLEGLVSEDDPLRARRTSALETMRRDARKAARLVRRFLEFARSEPLEATTVDPGSLLDRVKATLPSFLPEGVALDLRTPDPDLRVRADPTALENVLLGLLHNAADAMPEEGRLTVEVAPAPEDAPTLESHDGPLARIAVTDTGPGMDAETRRRALDPFFTTRGDDAPGLGLTVAYGKVRRMGGILSLDSEPGAGTTVEIFLPAEKPRGEEEPEPAPGRIPRVRGARILLVEDEETVRETTARLLERLEYHVVTAPHAEAALEVWRSADGFDLVLTDVVMPGPTGIELAEVIRAEDPGQKILFTSGYPSRELGRDPGDPPLPFLAKPFTVEELAAKVGEVLSEPE